MPSIENAPVVNAHVIPASAPDACYSPLILMFLYSNA
jgi:hypothetical protein